jgi:membrane-associated phospholipid phosphatase
MIKFVFMTTIKTKYLLLTFLLLAEVSFCRAENKAEKSAYPIHFLNRQLTEILINDNFSPVVASRVYAYTNIAAYTMLTESSKQNNLIAKTIVEYPHVQSTDALPEDFSPSLASAYTFLFLSKKLIYTFPPFEDSFKVLLNWYRSEGYSEAAIANSQKVAKDYAASFGAWMGKDMFSDTRVMPDYVLEEVPGSWVPTYPSYMPALEPHWQMMRKLGVNTGKIDLSRFKCLDYDTAQNSALYKEAAAVYKMVTAPAKELSATADFWDCNAFAVYPNGHVMTIVKKISPGGHWIYIAGIAAKKSNADMLKSQLSYALTAVAVYDAFICTWKLKYQHKAARPETYLQNVKDPDFRPYLQSPPFPEYPSGHAVISMSAAMVLTDLYGPSFHFIDNTEDYLGLPARSFSSFKDAAIEAGISRYYGGIHYKYSCDDGSAIGALVGGGILEGIKK